MNEDIRIDRLKEFSEYFRSRCSDDKRPYEQFLSATVTLQERNIGSDMRALCDFIHKEIGIPHINFKLATGSRSILAQPPDYLPDVESVKEFVHFLWHSPLADEPGNNLAYLRRCFAQGIFQTKDAVDGAPLRSFYESNPLRCFTPYLFALINLDGEVYPCCHLYRDNHGADSSTRGIRSQHSLGNALTKPFGGIWNAEKYRRKRQALTVINQQGDYRPCGECTRYCQHNIALNDLYQEYKKNPGVFDSLKGTEGPIWL